MLRRRELIACRWEEGGTPDFMKRKAPLRTILGQSEIPSGEWTISRLSAKQANFAGAATTEGKQPPITKSATNDKALFAGLINQE